MLNHPWIALAYSVALLGIGYLLSRLIHRGLKIRRTVNPVDQDATKNTEPPGPEPGETERGVAAAVPAIEVLEVPIAGSELHYYKLQALRTNRKRIRRLGEAASFHVQ
ncbi:hypothetical protein SBA4_6730004 [Candidatus Sulfopaludibacter sp. SbA4]|nr:hypothetical protein SBA4_6730004 [Candidatus Sulfopaludibacter sp. SbA4]